MLEEIIEAARQAGKIMLEAEKASIDVKEKTGSANFVTQYDMAVQENLRQALQKICPEADFLGEEGNERPEQTALVFIVDPIDGTTNFIHGYRHSAISIALAQNGKIEYGVVYNPYTEEVFSAARGRGAYRNGEPIHVSNRPMKEALICFGTSPYDPSLAEPSFRLAKRLFDIAADIRRSGSAALDLCAIAAGQCEFDFELVLQPWDFAASSLMIEEAGGRISRPDGTPLHILEPNPVIAGNRLTYDAFLAEGLQEGL